jgi:uncharacterized membrane protein
MPRKPNTTESYLKRLAEELEALGPDETADVIAEVRAHLAEAVAEAGGDEAAALDRFGTSDMLATRILEERGVLSPGSGVQAAPPQRWLLALLADISLWLAGLAIVVVPFFAIQVWAGGPSPVVVVAVLTMLALGVIGSAGWRIARWREPGNPTMGMRLTGLRRIRLGGASRVVRQRDVPGSPALRPLWPLVVTVLAVCVIASVVSSVALSSRAQMRSRIEMAVHDASLGQRIVGDMYRSVMRGATRADLEGIYAVSAGGAIEQLIERRATGKVESYEVGTVSLDDYDRRLTVWPEAFTIVVIVPVHETGKDPDATPVAYRWEVVCEMTDQGGGVSGGEWLIKSAGLVSE